MGPTTEHTTTARKAPATHGASFRHHLVRGLLPLLLLAPLAACRSARQCKDSIAPGLRADVIRFAIEQKLIPQSRVPEGDRHLALSQGTTDENLTDERRKLLYAPALGYANCVENHVRK